MSITGECVLRGTLKTDVAATDSNIAWAGRYGTLVKGGDVGFDTKIDYVRTGSRSVVLQKDVSGVIDRMDTYGDA